MQKPNLNRIIADNLDKAKFQTKSNPSLPTNGWLDQYKRGGGMFPEYHSYAPPRHAMGGEPCTDAQGNIVDCEAQRLKQLGSNAYTAMQPFYDTLYGAANKYANPDTGLVSPFNSTRATLKALIKHPSVMFMKRHKLPTEMMSQDPNVNPYHVQGYNMPGALKEIQWAPTDWAEPRKERNTGGGWENFKTRLRERGEERRGRRNRGSTGCWGANCIENEMQDQAKYGGEGPGDDELAFQKFFKTLPMNLRRDQPDYNIRGYWDALGRPSEFDYSQPKQDDGYYHASSRNPQTGEILKAPFHSTFKHAINEDRKAGYFPIVTPDGKIKTVSGNDLKPGQSVYTNGGDISIPDLQEGNWLMKYADGGITGDPNKPYSKTNSTGYVSMKNNKDWFDSHANWTNTGNQKWDAKVRQQVMTGRFGVDPNSGALIKLPQNEWTNVSDEDKRLATDKRQWTPTQKQQSWEKQVKPQIVQSTKNLITNPVMMAPGAILTGGMLSGIPAVAETAAAVAPALTTPIVSSIPGSSLANLAGSYFASDALVNRLPKVPGQIKTGDYAGATENALSGLLDLAGAGMVSPIYKGASNLVSEGKNLYKANNKFGSLSKNNQVNEGGASIGNWLKNGPDGPAVKLATDANTTIQREAQNIMQDLTSPEGATRLRNQFKIAMPTATDEQLDHMVGNRLREVNAALVSNKPRFYLRYGNGAYGTPSYGTEADFFPYNNAHFTNNHNPFPDVNNENAPLSLFNHTTPFHIGKPKNAKDLGQFANPDYRPGTMTLGEGYQFDPHTVRHEGHGHGIQGSGNSNKLPLEHDLLELAKPKSLRDKVWFEWKKRTDPSFVSDYDYFMKGNGSARETYPHLVENRSLMKERGIINNTYDKVGVDQLLQNKKQAELHVKYGIPNKNDRFLNMFPSWKLPKVADIWNIAPAVIPAVGTGAVGAAILNGEDKTTSSTSQQKYGGWLTKYGPGGETTDGCPPGFTKNAFGQCVNASGQNPNQAGASRNIISQAAQPAVVNRKPLATPFKTRSQQVEENTDRANRENYRLGEYSNQASVGQARISTIDDEKERIRKNNLFASQNSNAAIDQQGNLSRKQWDRSMEGVADPYTPAARFDKGMTHIMNGIETTSALTGAGQIGSNLLRLGASALERQVGRNILSRNLKNFTSSINPTLNAIDEAGAYVQLDPIGIMGNRLNSNLYNPTTALNTANNTITGLKKNLTNSAIEAVDVIAGENNLKNIVNTSKVSPTGKQSFGEMFRSSLSLEKPKESGLDFMNRWYRHPKIIDRYQAFKNPSPALDNTGQYLNWIDAYKQTDKLGNARAALTYYVPKTYRDLWKDKGWKQGLEGTLTSSGLSYGTPTGIYSNRGLFPRLGKIGQERIRGHELTHLITNNGRLFNSVENDALLTPFNMTYAEYKAAYPTSEPSLNPFNNNAGYYLDPTEIHARMNEGRMHLGLTPDDIFTEDHYRKIKKDHNWFGMGKLIKDPKKMIHLMNNFYTPAGGVLGAGVLGYNMMGNGIHEQGHDQQKYGGWLNNYAVGGVTSSQVCYDPVTGKQIPCKPGAHKTWIFTENPAITAPDVWLNGETRESAVNNNEFTKEAEDLKNYLIKNQPGEDIEIYPTYRSREDDRITTTNRGKTLNEILRGSDANTRLAFLAHHGDILYGSPISNLGKKLQATTYDNCYLGSCFSGDIAASDEFKGLTNFHFRPGYGSTFESPNGRQGLTWLGVNPNKNSQTGEAGVNNAFYNTSYNIDALNNLYNEEKYIENNIENIIRKNRNSKIPLDDKRNPSYKEYQNFLAQQRGLRGKYKNAYKQSIVNPKKGREFDILNPTNGPHIGKGNTLFFSDIFDDTPKRTGLDNWNFSNRGLSENIPINNNLERILTPVQFPHMYRLQQTIRELSPGELREREVIPEQKKGGEINWLNKYK
jgi:hypothetical protein